MSSSVSQDTMNVKLARLIHDVWRVNNLQHKMILEAITKEDYKETSAEIDKQQAELLARFDEVLKILETITNRTDAKNG